MKVFVDGQEGTTGLKINERLAGRPDLELLKVDQERRKDLNYRKAKINEADVVFLCLPDPAAIEAVAILENTTTKIIDASTAHRTSDNWAYGLPELSPSHREAIRQSRFVSVPGCHATGFALGLYPLIASGVMGRDYPVTCFSLTGYSGGGKKLIEQYETARAGDPRMLGCRPYALSLTHKHLPEMTKATGLAKSPVFNPVLGPFSQGMIVTIPIVLSQLEKKLSAKDLHDVISKHYSGEKFVKVAAFGDDSALDDGCLDPQANNGTNRADIFVFGHDTQACIMCRLDNLGKGASGAAVQCMNIMTGNDEGSGLTIY
jgi:N-acetyl-gamma-glutamyl-phosphate reductase